MWWASISCTHVHILNIVVEQINLVTQELLLFIRGILLPEIYLGGKGAGIKVGLLVVRTMNWLCLIIVFILCVWGGYFYVNRCNFLLSTTIRKRIDTFCINRNFALVGSSLFALVEDWFESPQRIHLGLSKYVTEEWPKSWQG